MPIGDSSRSRLFWLVLLSSVALVGTAAVCGLALGHLLPLGVRGEPEPWGFVPRWSPLAVLSGCIVGAVYTAFVALGYRLLARLEPAASWPWEAAGSSAATFRARRSATILLAALVPVSCALSLGMQQAAPAEFDLGKWVLVLYHPGPSGYYTAARGEVRDVHTFLEHYREFQARQDPFHLGTHPPGLILLHYGALELCRAEPGLARALVATEPASVWRQFRDLRTRTVLPLADEASLWLVGLFTQLCSALTVLPLYAIARRAARPAAAWSAVCFWPLTPAVLLFMPKSDVLYPLLATSVLALALGARPGPLGRLGLVLAGLLLWIGMFLSFALVALVPLVAVVFLRSQFQRGSGPLARERGAGRPFPNRAGSPRNGAARAPAVSRAARGLGAAVCLAAGFLLPTLVLYGYARHNLLVTWWDCYVKHASFYERVPRTYGPWVLFNGLEWGVAMGIPLATWAIAGLVLVARHGRVDAREVSAKDAVAAGGRDSVAWLIAAWGLLVLVLDVSGKNRGEVARLWIFLMPLATVAAAVALDRLRPGVGVVALWVLLAAIQAAVFMNSIETFYDPLSMPPQPELSRRAGIRVERLELDVIDPELANVGPDDPEVERDRRRVAQGVKRLLEPFPAPLAG